MDDTLDDDDDEPDEDNGAGADDDGVGADDNTGVGGDEDNDGGAGAEGEGAEDTDVAPQANFLSTTWSFIVTFFMSLIPEGPQNAVN
jgi:hypothetical protein